MIEKIEIMQHDESCNHGSHPCEETRRLFGIAIAVQTSYDRAAYHHEMVIVLRKDGLDSFSGTFIGSCRWYIVPIHLIEGNVGSFKIIQLYESTPVVLVFEPSHIAPVGTGFLAHLVRFGIDVEKNLGSVDSLYFGMKDASSKQYCLFTTLVVMPECYQVRNDISSLICLISYILFVDFTFFSDLCNEDLHIYYNSTYLV